MRDRFDPLRRIPLTAVLRACGAQPDRYDKAKWHTSEGTLSVTGTKFMNWQRSQGGGGAIDLAMHLNHLAFPAAVAGSSGSFRSRFLLHRTRRLRAVYLYRRRIPTNS